MNDVRSWAVLHANCTCDNCVHSCRRKWFNLYMLGSTDPRSWSASDIPAADIPLMYIQLLRSVNSISCRSIMTTQLRETNVVFHNNCWLRTCQGCISQTLTGGVHSVECAHVLGKGLPANNAVLIIDPKIKHVLENLIKERQPLYREAESFCPVHPMIQSCLLPTKKHTLPLSG